MLKIKIVNEIPQWIISTDKAAYHPYSNTIYLRKDRWWKDILHELAHWIAYKIGGRDCWIHNWLDNKGKRNET